MDVSQMRMMLALADCKSMTTTAKKLHVTQPALTYQLKVIETELGFKVFNRTRTGTSLTAEGAFLHETIKAIVAEYDETVRLARAMAIGTAVGTIRIGVNGSSRDTVSFLLNVARSTTSFTTIPCGDADPVKLLQEGVIDFWSTSDAAMQHAPSSLRFLELSLAKQLAFMPSEHRLAQRSTIDVADLAGETVWMWPSESISRAADKMRLTLEELGADVQDLVRGIPAALTSFMGDGVVVYDEGFLPPPTQTAVQVPISDADPDRLGLAYLASQEKRLAPIAQHLAERNPLHEGRVAGSSEMAAERIVAVLDEISATVRRGGMKDIVPLVEYALSLGVSANHVLNRGLLTGMSSAGDAYAQGQAFTSEVMASVATVNLAMETLRPRIAIEDEKPVAGTAVIGTVIGDRHDIGKNIVRIMLESRDIKVEDLGNQVPPQAFVEHVRGNVDCNLVLISVNRNELRPNARAIVEALEKAKQRERVFVMVGGAAADEEFAEEIGADAFTASAEDAVETAIDFLRI